MHYFTVILVWRKRKRQTMRILGVGPKIILNSRWRSNYARLRKISHSQVKDVYQKVCTIVWLNDRFGFYRYAVIKNRFVLGEKNRENEYPWACWRFDKNLLWYTNGQACISYMYNYAHAETRVRGSLTDGTLTACRFPT